MKKQKVYAFIDSQNLNLGTSKDLLDREGRLVYQGWKLDYRKFRIYLADKFGVEKAILFIGYMDKYRPMYKMMERYGYTLVYKPTVKDHEGKVKGNVDAELVLHAAAIEYPHYDRAVVVSGDGDFYCLYEWLIKQERLKGILIPNTKSESSLLKNVQSYKTFLIFDKEKVEYRDIKKRGASHIDTESKVRIPPRDRVSVAKKGKKSR